MHELQSIIDAADSTEGPMFLATVVDVDGSAYRRPGARILIQPNGGRVGMISGGCLERDLCRQAAALCKNGPRLISFDTRSDSATFNTRYNLGCSGVIYILVEPITHDAACPLQPMRETLRCGYSAVIGTVYHSEGFDQLPVGHRIQSAVGMPETVSPGIQSTFERVARNGKPVCCHIASRSDDSNARILVEKMAPPKPFWIFGAGDDAIPLANIAGNMGWSVIVIDDRPGNLTAARFPQAKRLLADSLATIRENLEPRSETCAVLMTHCFDRDSQILPWLCESGLSYVGLLGPKSRTARLVKKMHSNGALPSPEEFAQVRSPTGLDIGATNPAQIAVSIVGEVIAMENARNGRPLSTRNEPIHDPVSHQLVESDPGTTRQTARFR